MTEEKNCKAKECAREIFAKGYCRKHYRLWKRGEMPKPRYNICTEEKCRKARFRGSLCEQHYNASRSKGAEAPAAPAPEAASN